MKCVIDKYNNKFIGVTERDSTGMGADVNYLFLEVSEPIMPYREGYETTAHYINNKWVFKFMVPFLEPLIANEQAILDTALNIEYLVTVTELKI